MVGSHQDALISGTGAHRGESVHVLCAGDTGNAVEGKGGNTLSGELLHHLVVHGRGGVDEGDEVLAFVHHLNLVLAQLLVEERLFHLQDHVGLLVDFLGVVEQFGTGGCIVLVVIEGTVACGLFY